MRYWEIDTLRGIAIIMMIIFHTLFDLNYFAGFTFKIYSLFWWAFARLTASIFIFLVGLNLTISKSKGRQFDHFLKRGIKIFGYGLIITLLTYLFLPEGTVYFGILHFIGISIILGYFFLKFDIENLLLGILLSVLGLYLKLFSFPQPWLIWLGLRSQTFYTFDYFPLLPWFGLILIGIFFGRLLYPNGKRKYKIPELTKFPISLLNFLGRNSLLIYLFHQPILIGLIKILF